VNQATAFEALREFVRRAKILKLLRDKCFPQQLAFIDDPSRLKAALCSRRAGKSMAAAIYLLLEAFRRPRTVCLYVALTRGSAKNIMWSLLKKLNRELELGMVPGDFNESDLTARLPNGSFIRLFGADSDQKQREKLLGDEYSLVVVDEAASFRIDLKTLIFSIIKPATDGVLGSIVCIGTPADFRNFFYTITEEDNDDGKQWSRHRWNTLDNPHMRENWTKSLAEIELTRPLYKETPEFKCMYLGQWVLDFDKLVYKFSPERNTIAAKDLPDLDTYLLAIDLGWNDATAFTVVGWRENDSTLYVVESFKKTEMLIDDVAKETKRLGKKYDVVKMMIDGQAKQAVQELKTRYLLPVTPTDKHAKSDFIRMMNTDLLMKRVKLVRGSTEDLAEEWRLLVWDERNVFARKELDSCKNDAADSCLYAWRASRNYVKSDNDAPEVLDPHGEEAVDAFWEEKAARINDVFGDDDY
jgi:hypothetical protein